MSSPIDYLNLYIMFLIAGLIACLLVLLASLLGPKKVFPSKIAPFECGMTQLVSPRQRFSVKFYLIAMFFIIFDIETVFLYPWAVLFRELSWFGFWEMSCFLLVFVLGLVYVWKKGALEWE